jgi:signal transduction histidine kinase
MNPYALPPLITSIFVFLLGCFAFLQNRRAKPNFLFLLETIAIFLWLFSDYMMYSTQLQNKAFIWAKVSYIGAIFIPVFFFHFSLSFLSINKFKFSLFASYILGALFLLSLLLTSHLIAGAGKHYWGYYPKIGFLHTYFMAYYGFVLATTFSALYSHSKDQARPPQERNKIKLVLLAFVIGFMALSDVFPKYGIDYYPVGFAFLSVWMFLLGYAIVKHRLFDIKVVISGGAAYALTFIFAILPVAIIIFFLQRVFPLTISIALILALSVVLAFLFAKIHPFSERIVQKRLLKTQLNYYQILRKFSQDMVTALDLRDLLKRFDETLREAMQVTSVAVYLTGPLNGKYPLSHPLRGDSDIFAVLRNEQKPDHEAAVLQTATMASMHHSGVIPLWKSGDALVALAYQAKDVLVLGEMEMMARERENARLEEAITQMKDAKAEVCVPLKRDGKMIGIALLGPREGDRYYSPDDLGLLHMLGQNACVAIQNALLVEELKKSYLLLQRTQRLAAMGSLIAGVSHEIRNPLMPISFLMDSITDASIDKDLLARLSEHSRESLRRIVSVLDEMDQLARPYTPSFKKTDINQIADDALLLLDTQIKLRKQEVVRQYDPLSPTLVDSERLKHALLDILLNAVEANAENGKIYVRTREVLMKPTRAYPSRTGIQIEITDTGCGIPEENLERVFDPFFTTKHKSLMREGTGLGLAIAHRIVEEHHGSMEIRSEEGKGTTVFVNLPVDR